MCLHRSPRGNFKISTSTRTQKQRQTKPNQTKPNQGTWKIMKVRSLKVPAIMQRKNVHTYIHTYIHTQRHTLLAISILI
jgi:hypothetical protein